MGLKEDVDIRLRDPNTILDIYQNFLGPYVRQSDKEYKFSSPNSSDTTPSFGVDPNKLGLYNDFSDGDGGNIYSFLKKVNVDKPLLWLADYLNIEKKAPAPKEPQPVYASMKIMKQAKLYLEAHPQLKEILYQKGFTEEQIKGFNGVGIGYLDNRTYRKRFFIPILDEARNLVNIRLYDPTSSSPGMKVISFYMYLDNLSKVPAHVQESLTPKDLAALQAGSPVKLSGFGKARLGYLPSLNNGDTIYIMEGERDAFNALAHGYAATWVTGGANTWKHHFNDLFTDKHVVIVADNDSAGESGAAKKADAIGSKAKSIKIVNIPIDKKGADFADYMQVFTKQDFDKMVEATEPVRLTHEETQLATVTIHDKSLPINYAKYLCSTIDLIFVNKQGFYTYQQEGFWKATDDMKLENDLFNLYESFGYKAPTKAGLANAMKALTHIHFAEDRPDSEHRYVNCVNGLFDLKEKRLISHNKEIFTTYQLPVDYDPQAACPRFMQYLEEVFPSDTDAFADLIGEILGYSMTTDTSFQKAFILIGTGANGKSVLIELLEALVGKESVSSVGFNELSNSFSRSQLKDKLINVGAEIEFSTTANSSYFKQIVAGDTISAQEKYKPEYIFKPHCKLVYSTNGFPSTKDRSEGNYRRYLFIPFEVYFPEDKQDKQLIHKLKAEMSGVLNFALSGMERLYKNGAFTAPGKSKNMLTEFKSTSSPLIMFFNEEVVQATDKEKISRSIFVKQYKEWCMENSYKPMSTQRVSKELRDMYNVASVRTSDGWNYTGLAFKDFSNSEAPSTEPEVINGEAVEKLNW